MNTRFSYNLLQLFSKKRNDGFAMVLVTLCGIVILVVGAGMLLKGTNDRNQVVSQKVKMVADNAAEAGLARFNQFLLENPSVGMLPSSDYGDLDKLVDKIKESTAPAFNENPEKNLDDILNFCPSSPGGTNSESADDGETGDSTVTAKANYQKEQLLAMMSEKGIAINPADTGSMAPRFRVIVYTPDEVTGDADLVVEGMAGDRGKSRIKVKMPAQKQPNTVTVTQPLNVPATFPSLWVNGNGGAVSNLNNVYTNVVGPCESVSTLVSTPVTDNKFATNKDEIQYKFIQTDVEMPASPASGSIPSAAVDLDGISLNGQTLPRATDSSNLVDGRYIYKVSSLSLKGNGSNSGKLSFQEGKKVTLYVTGKIDISASDIEHSCGTLDASGDGKIDEADCNASDVLIIGTSDSTTPTVELGGNASICNVFLWASTYSVEASGVGGKSAQKCSAPATTSTANTSDPHPNNTGVYWVKSFQGTSSSKSEQKPISAQNSNIWPYIIDAVNSVGLATPMPPLEVTQNVTYFTLNLGQAKKWARIQAGN